MKPLVLVLVTVGVGLVIVPAAEWWIGPGHAFPALVGAAICLPAAVMTLTVADRLWRRMPQAGVALALAGTMVRGLGAVVGVALFDGAMRKAGVPTGRFVGWVAAFYIVTLAAESALLVARPPSGSAGPTAS